MVMIATHLRAIETIRLSNCSAKQTCQNHECSRYRCSCSSKYILTRVYRGSGSWRTSGFVLHDASNCPRGGRSSSVWPQICAHPYSFFEVTEMVMFVISACIISCNAMLTNKIPSARSGTVSEILDPVVPQSIVQPHDRT